MHNRTGTPRQNPQKRPEPTRRAVRYAAKWWRGYDYRQITLYAVRTPAGDLMWVDRHGETHNPENYTAQAWTARELDLPLPAAAERALGLRPTDIATPRDGACAEKRDAFLCNVADLAAAGEGRLAAAKRTGYRNPDSFDRQLWRLGERELRAQLRARDTAVA